MVRSGQHFGRLAYDLINVYVVVIRFRISRELAANE